MNVILPVPDDRAHRLAAEGGDIACRALEAFSLAEYRARRLTDAELCRMLGLESRIALDALLKARPLRSTSFLCGPDLLTDLVSRHRSASGSGA